MVVNGWLAHNDKDSSSRHFNLLDASLPIAQSSCPKDKLYYCPVPVQWCWQYWEASPGALGPYL